MNKEAISALATEQRNLNTVNIDMEDTLTMVRSLGGEYANIAEAVLQESESIAAAVDCITERMNKGGRLIYVGAGTSGRLGILDASECRPTFSLPDGRVIGIIAGGETAIRNAVENVEDDRQAAIEQLNAHSLNSGDVVCAVAASGRTPYAIGALEYAKSLGAATICVSNSKNCAMAKYSDIAIEAEVGAEPLTGSTRMKSGSAQKMILNILSTAAMIKQGKTYGNLMVDVSATNLKLRKRSVNILKMIMPQATEEEIENTLTESGGRVKLAALMLKKNITSEQAQKLLDEKDGFLRKAMEE